MPPIFFPTTPGSLSSTASICDFRVGSLMYDRILPDRRRKNMKRIASLARAAALALLAFAAAPVLAQGYPTKPIRILIAQAPGSATDVISRVVGNRLSEALGQPVVIEARPGAGGMLGTEAAARSA